MVCQTSEYPISNINILGRGDDSTQHVVGQGIVTICTSTSFKTQIHDVLHVPQLKKNLFSISKSTQYSTNFEFIVDKCIIRKVKNLKAMIVCSMQGLLHPIWVGFPTIEVGPSMLTKHENQVLLWHQRLGRLNLITIKNMQSKKLVIGIIGPIRKLPMCQSFLVGKQHCCAFPHDGKTYAIEMLEITHLNICCPNLNIKKSQVLCHFYFYF